MESDFLRCFGLTSLAELPDIHTDGAAEALMQMGRQMMLDDDTDENQLTLDAAIDPEGEQPITLAPTETIAEDEE